MRILVTTLGPPLPLDRGARVRDFELVRRLALRHEVILAPVVAPGLDLAPLRALGLPVADLVPITSPESTARIPVRGPLLAGHVPLASLPYIGWGARRRFAKVVTAARPTVVQVEHSFLSPLIDCGEGSYRRVLSLHNVAATQYASIARSAHGLERGAGLVKQRLATRLERRYLPRFDAVVVVSGPDRDAVLRLDPGAHVTVVENGTDVHRLRPLGRPSRRAVLFIANLEYAPNERAARWLCEEIVPALSELSPPARVRLVGPGGSRSLRSLAVRAGVEIFGAVADVVPHYEWASVCVVPMRGGGGTRLKILEAMALGRPVVSTSIGASGLELEPNRHFLLADDTQGLARQITRLLDDEELWMRVSAEARARVVARHDWDRLADKLVHLHEQLARR